MLPSVSLSASRIYVVCINREPVKDPSTSQAPSTAANLDQPSPFQATVAGPNLLRPTTKCPGSASHPVPLFRLRGSQLAAPWMANAHSSPHFRDCLLRIHRISISPALSPSRWHELRSQQPISLTLSPCYSDVCLPQFSFPKPSSTTPESFNKRSLKFATLNPWFEFVPAPIKPV